MTARWVQELLLKIAFICLFFAGCITEPVSLSLALVIVAVLCIGSIGVIEYIGKVDDESASV